jgi:hypothetical protein
MSARTTGQSRLKELTFGFRLQGTQKIEKEIAGGPKNGRG